MTLAVALLLSLLQLGDSLHSVNRARLASPLAPDSLASFANAFMEKALAETHTSGAAVVFVVDGHVVVSTGYGLANRETGTPVDPARTLWRLASTSKSLTALAVLELAQRGTVSLDDDVNAHLRAFKVPAAFGAPITIRELLRHTSGLDDRLIGDGFISGTPSTLTAVMAARLPRRIRPPGSFLYSNYDYGLLGAVVEAEGGVPFDAFMRDTVLAPIGMRRTTFTQPVPPQWLADVAIPYAFGGGAFHRWPVIYHQSSPGGGATATADDMGRYMQVLLDDSSASGARPVSRESVREAFGLDGLTGTDRFSAGFAWRSRIWNGERVVETGGDLPGFTNLLILIPNRHLGMWIANNSGKNAVTLGFLWAFLDRFFPHASAQQESASLGPWPDSLAQFTGTYRPARYPHDELSKLGIIPSETSVSALADGTLSFWGERWFRVGPLQFQRASGPLVLTFGRDASGRIMTLDNMERISWYETKNVQLALVILFIVTFLGVALSRLVARLRRRGVAGVGVASTPVPGAVIGASLLNIAFLVGIVIHFATTPSYSLMLGLSPTLRAVLTLPLISLALSALVARQLVQMLRSRRVGVGTRATSGLFMIVTVGFFVFLNHWNLLGFRG